MSETDPMSPAGESDEELKNALMAAFGDNAMSMIEEDEDEIPAELLAAFGAEIQAESPESSGQDCTDFESAATIISNRVAAHAGLTLRDDDSPRTSWIKNLSSAIYAGHLKSDRQAVDRTCRYVVFSIAESRFGVPLSDVREIGRYPKVTPLPCTPPWLRGVANFRGQILSVTDLRSLIGDSSQRPNVGENVIVVQHPNSSASTALVVDCLIGIRSLGDQSTDAAQLPSNSAAIACGTAVIDQLSTVLIDIDRLFGLAELNAFA